MRAQETYEESSLRLREYLGKLSFVSEQDADIITTLFSSIQPHREVNNGLREHPALVSQLAWYCLKYRSLADEAQQQYKKSYNTVYLDRRSKGYDEWASKSYAEQAVQQELAYRDACRSFSDYLHTLHASCDQRLRSLESLSHNLRAERR